MPLFRQVHPTHIHHQALTFHQTLRLSLPMFYDEMISLKWLHHLIPWHPKLIQCVPAFSNFFWQSDSLTISPFFYLCLHMEPSLYLVIHSIYQMVENIIKFSWVHRSFKFMRAFNLTETEIIMLLIQLIVSNFSTIIQDIFNHILLL